MKKPKSLWAQLAAGADTIVSQLAQRRPHLGRPRNWWCKESGCVGSGSQPQGFEALRTTGGIVEPGKQAAAEALYELEFSEARHC